MGTTGFIDTEQAHALLESMLDTVSRFDGFCTIGNDDLLPLARKLELLTRRIYALHINITDEINTRNLATTNACTSTAALLRQALNITITEANNRVRAALALIPQDLPTGARTPAALPALSAAVIDGAVDAEHIKVILDFTKKIPGNLPASEATAAQEFLTTQAAATDAHNLRAIADYLQNALNPDGTLHSSDPHERMELAIGRRNQSTGLTTIKGRLDDIGIHILRTALDPLTAPGHQPTPSSRNQNGSGDDGTGDGAAGDDRTGGSDSPITGDSASDDTVISRGAQTGNADDVGAAAAELTNAEPAGAEPPDPDGTDDADDFARLSDTRPPATRLAHALIEALHTLLNTGALPSQGGERPHITIVMDWDHTRQHLHSARLPDGNYLDPATARALLCDAQITPAILNTQSEVLDLGRTRRTFTPAIRKALTLRDGGCAWPACSRPPQWTDAHHIHWWKKDLGPTSLTNGVLLCQHHHTEIHKNQWKIHPNHNSHPDFIPPSWIDPSQKPRRNTLHHNTNQFRVGHGGPQ